MRIVTILATILSLIVAPALAQDILPPDAARVIASSTEGVVMQWPGSPKARYFVQIYTGQVVAVEQEVTGNSISVPLRAGLGYQWKVSLVQPKGYQEVVPSRSFQVVSETQMVVAGANGSQGGQGRRRANFSLDGKPGAAGLSLTATLSKMDGGYVSLSVTGAPANRLYYFSPGAPTFLLASLGGQGGGGGQGFYGANADFNYQTGYVILPEAGGNGGNGGEGGAGGNITVVANDLLVNEYLTFDTRGGQGGAAGPGGRGGAGLILPVQWQGRVRGYGNNTSIPRAPDGNPGADGKAGPMGQVFVR